jgi:hypothetical protein
LKQENGMPTTYQIVALSSLDPDGSNTRDEPKLVFPDALKTAQGSRIKARLFACLWMVSLRPIRFKL